MQESYYGAAVRDPEASVWRPESDIPGFVIEADTLAEFEQAMNALAPEMLAENETIHGQRVKVEFRVRDAREFAVAWSFFPIPSCLGASFAV